MHKPYLLLLVLVIFISGCSSYRYVDISELSENPSSYVGQNIKTTGYLVKNEWMPSAVEFVVPKYTLNAYIKIGSGPQIRIPVSGKDLDKSVTAIYNGSAYKLVSNVYVNIYGRMRDMGNVQDTAQYILEINKIEELLVTR